jgi:hypothetical protein
MAEGEQQRLEVRPSILCLGTHYAGATIRGSVKVLGATSFVRCYERF